MRGIKIALALLVATATLLTIVLWPADVTTSRKLTELENTLEEVDQTLFETADSLRRITAKKQHTNRHKNSLEEHVRLAEIIRHQARRLKEDENPHQAAERQTRVAELQSQAERVLGDVRNFRATILELEASVDKLVPLRAEVQSLRARLSELLDRERAGAGRPDRIKQYREAIELSSNQEELIKKAWQAYSGSIQKGRVLTGTAENELGELMARMRELVASGKE